MKSMPEIGDVVDETYELVGLLGRGGFGAVYRARQLKMDRDVALKLLTASGPKFSEMVKRFRREVMAIRNLTHPNTVRIYDFHDDPDGLLYYTMEALNGNTLKQEVRNSGPLSPRRLRHIMVQVLKSLSEAHSYNIVHRDLKPSNIMLVEMHGETDFVKVLDFGIAKIMHDGGEDDHVEELTSAGVLVGTLKYMAPEQIATTEAELGPCTDLYALGLIAVEMLTGQSIYSGSGRWEVLRQQVSDEPVDIPEPVLRSPLGAVLGRCLQKDPEQRYRTAQQVIDDLQALDESRLDAQPLFVSDGADGWIPRGATPAHDDQGLDDFDDLKTVVIDEPVDDNATEITPQPSPSDRRLDGGEADNFGPNRLPAVSSTPAPQQPAQNPASGPTQNQGQRQAAHHTPTPRSSGGFSSPDENLDKTSPLPKAQPDAQPVEANEQSGQSEPELTSETAETDEPSDLYPELRANSLRKGTVVQQTEEPKWRRMVPMVVGFVLVVGLGAGAGWVFLSPSFGGDEEADEPVVASNEEVNAVEQAPQPDDDVDEQPAPREEASQEPTDRHSVTIDVDDGSPRARVYIDDDVQGRTPHTLELDEGQTLVLRLEATDHEPHEIEVDWESSPQLEVALQPVEEQDEPESVADRGETGDEASERSYGSGGTGDRGDRQPDRGGEADAPSEQEPDPEPDPEPEPDDDDDDGWVDIQRGDDSDEERPQRDVPIF